MLQSFISELERRGLPSLDNYLAMDTECTVQGRQLIKQFGYCLVRNRQVVKQGSLIINWVGRQEISIRDLRSSFEKEAWLMGRRPSVGIDAMQERGRTPEQVTHSILSLLRETERKGYYIVGQNLLGLDQRLLSSHAEFLMGEKYQFPDNLVFDTGAIYKASQISPPPMLKPRETLKSFFNRVVHQRVAGLKWNLGVCLQSLKVDFDLAQMHDAEYDSYCCYLLLEAMRKRYEQLT